MANAHLDGIVVSKNEINEIKHTCNSTWSFFSFPGGKKDPEDKSVIETAVREMEEEMGLEKSCVQVWAQMPAMPDRVITSTCFHSNGLNPGIFVVHTCIVWFSGEGSSENTDILTM